MVRMNATNFFLDSVTHAVFLTSQLSRNIMKSAIILEENLFLTLSSVQKCGKDMSGNKV